MMRSGRRGVVGSAFVRLLLAVALLVVASLQPAMIAVAKPAMHPSQAETLHQAEQHHHGDVAVHSPSSGNDASHHGDVSAADSCCDMQCMPGTGLPPCAADLAHPAAGAFEHGASDALLPGETHELIRPPRT